MSFPIRAIVKLRRILLIGLVIAGAFYAVMLMPKMLRLLRKLNQEDIGKEIIFSRIASTLIVPLDTGACRVARWSNFVENIINKKSYEPARAFRDLWSLVPINHEMHEQVHTISYTY